MNTAHDEPIEPPHEASSRIAGGTGSGVHAGGEAGAGASLIALDWGTTSLRAYLLDGHGTILQRRHARQGIRNVADRDFAGALAHATQGWDPGLPIVACGMIGSRNGWHEVAYRDAPAGIEQLSASLAVVPGARLSIVPGVRYVDRHGDPDVMRGEETQLAGAVIASGRSDALFVHPGTHAKWARMRSRRIEAFATFMTGELYATLLAHSILGAFAPQPLPGQAGRADSPEPGADGFDWTPFDRGVSRALACADFVHALFTARSRLLEADLQPQQVPEYLSGLLIGEELRGARAAGWIEDGERATLIGDERLVARYARAFEQGGVAFDIGPADVAVIGLQAIAKAAAMVN